MTAPAPLLDKPSLQPARTAPRIPRHRTRRRTVVWVLVALAVLALLVMALGLAGGSGGSSGSSASTASTAVGIAPAGAGTDGSTPAKGLPETAPAGSRAGAAAAGPGIASSSPGQSAVPPSVSAEKVVTTGQVELLAAKGRVSSTLTAVQQAVAAQGGVVSGSATQESGTSPFGTVTLRVPVDHFGALLLQVRALGVGVRSAQTSSTDVTGQSVDLAAQDRTLLDTRAQLLDIKRKATNVTDILAVQQRIDDITGRINEVEGQAAVLRDQAAMSTLSVTVRETGDPVYAPGPTPAKGGLGQAFRDAGRGFVNGVEAIVRHSGGVLLFLLCLLVLTPIALFAYRTARRRLSPDLRAPGPAAPLTQ